MNQLPVNAGFWLARGRRSDERLMLESNFVATCSCFWLPLMGRLQLFMCTRRTSGGKRRTVFGVGGLENVRQHRVATLALFDVAALRTNRVVVFAILLLQVASG